MKHETHESDRYVNFELASANDEVCPIADTTVPKSKRQKTGQQFYSGEICTGIGRYVD